MKQKPILMSFETFVTEELAKINDTLSAIAENSKKIEDLPPYVGNLPSGGQVPFTSAGNTYKIDPKSAIDTAIQAQVADSTILNNVTTSSAVSSTGNIHAIGVGPGTYTNWGGMVIPTGNIGTLQRVGGVYSVSLTPITIPTSKSEPWTNSAGYAADVDRTYLGKLWKSNATTATTDVPGTSPKWVDVLTGYLEQTDIIDELNSTEKQKPISADAARRVYEAILNILSIYSLDQDGKFAVSDTNGNIALKLDDAGNLLFNETKLQFLAKLIREGFPLNSFGNIDLSLYELFTGTDENAFAVCDKEGYIGLKLTDNSLEYVGKTDSTPAVVGADIPKGTYASDIMMLLTYGQSNATGSSFTSGNVSTNVLGFTRGTESDGVVTQYDAATAKSTSLLNAFYGADFVDITYGNGSQTEAALNQILRLISSENDKTLADLGVYLCGSNPSQGGTQIYQLNYVTGINVNDNPNWQLSDGIVWTQGSEYGNEWAIYMTRLLQSVWYAKKHADNICKTFSVPVLSWVHGEAHQSDLNLSGYYDQMVLTFNRLNTLIKKITNQTNDVEFLVFQTAIHLCPLAVSYGSLDSIPMAQLKIAKEVPNVSFSFTMLPFESTPGDYVHYLTNMYAVMGIYTGIQAKRLIIDKVKPKPLIPLSYKITQSITGGFLLEVKYDTLTPLVFDDTQPFFNSSNKSRGIRPNYGFSLKKILYVSEDIPSSTLYTKATAIVAIPTQLKKNGLVIKIKVNAGTTPAAFEYYQFTGDYTDSFSWNNVANWNTITVTNENTYELLTGTANIAIRREDTIVFKCSENPKGYFLKYGYEVLSNTTGGGNLRDSQNTSSFVAGSSYTINNFSPIHKLEL